MSDRERETLHKVEKLIARLKSHFPEMAATRRIRRLIGEIDQVIDAIEGSDTLSAPEGIFFHQEETQTTRAGRHSAATALASPNLKAMQRHSHEVSLEEKKELFAAFRTSAANSTSHTAQEGPTLPAEVLQNGGGLWTRWVGELAATELRLSQVATRLNRPELTAVAEEVARLMAALHDQLPGLLVTEEMNTR